jgi:tape measure domain-containing protein
MTDYQIRIIVSAQDNASGPLGKVGSALGSMGTIAGGIISAQLFQNIANGIADLGRQAMDATASWERMGLAMQSMIAREMVNAGQFDNLTDAMGAAIPKSKELLHWLEGLAINSPFDAEGVANTYRMGLTFGFSSDKAKELTQILIDMSAGMGLTSSQMEHVGYALGQINASDKLLMQDLRQLMNVGVPVQDILKKMGYSLADVGTSAISSQEFLKVFNEEMGGGFEGAAAKQAKSWAGLLNSMDDIKKIGLREFFSSTFDAVQPLIGRFVDKFSDPKFIESLRKWGEPLGEAVGNMVSLIDRFDEFKDGVGQFSIKDAILKGVGALGGVGLAGAFAAALGPSLLGGISLIFGSGLPFLKGIVGKGLFSVFSFGQGSIFAGLTIALSGLAPKLGGLFFKTFMVGGIFEKIGGAFLKIGAFAKFLAPLSGIITFGAPLLLIATAVMTVVGAFQLLEKGKLKELLAPLGDSFARIQETVSGLLPFLVEMGEYIGGAFLQASEELAANVIPWLVEQFDKFSLWFKENQPLIQEFIQTIADFIVHGLIPAVVGAWQFIEPILTGLVDLILGLAVVIMQVATGDWAGAWETMQATAGKVWESLKKAFWGFMNWIANLMGSSLAEIGAVWASNWEQLQQISTAVLNIVVDYLESFLANVVYKITSYANSILTAWRNIWTGFSNVLASAFNGVQSYLAGQLAGVANALYGKIYLFTNLGYDIVEGIENGIKNAWKALINTFNNLVSLLPASVKKILGIASPSKVFEGLGRNMMQGWEQGLIRNSSLPIQATLTTAGAVASAGNVNRTTNWNVTINHPKQDEVSVRDDLRLLQLAAA